MLQAELIPSAVAAAGHAANQDPYQAWFDAARLPSPLIVRQRQPGDRIQPVGMGGKSVKLSDLMINLKLPYRSRATWPVVCVGDQVIWLPGCRQSHLALPDASTRQVLQLRLLHFPADSDTP